MPKILLLAALMAQSLPVAIAAEAQSQSLRVSYADLDLNSAAGQRALDRRLRRAIASLCPDDNGIRDFGRLAAIRQCRANKMEQAAPQRAQALATAGRRTMAAARH